MVGQSARAALLLIALVLAGLGCAAPAASGAAALSGSIAVGCMGCIEGDGIVVLDLETRSADLRVPTTSTGFAFRWSPDGTSFALRRPAGRVEVADDESAPRVLADENAPYRGGIDWSPDGRRLVIGGLESKQSGRRRAVLWTIDVTTGNASILSRMPLGQPGNVYDPDWSPDGSTIVATSSDHRLWLIDARTGHVRPFPRRTLRGSNPTWSPDGTRLVVAQGNGIPGRLAVASADGRSVRTVGGDPGMTPGAGFAWSPDGQWLVYVRCLPVTTTYGVDCIGHELRLVRADGLGRRRLRAPGLLGDEGAWSGLDWHS